MFFAGEATEPVDYGTVHAALWSGEQAAEAIFRAATGAEPLRRARPWGIQPSIVIDEVAPMTLANILFFCVILSGLATLGMLFAGLISMARNTDPVPRGGRRQQQADVVARAPAAPDDRLHPAVVSREQELIAWSQLTRIYTRGGDAGKTSLGRGERVAKHDLRVEAYGTIDEANAVIGLARAPSCAREERSELADVDAMLARIQNDLFDLGADLCTPEGKQARRAGAAHRAVADRAAGARDRRHERRADAAQLLHPARRQRGRGLAASRAAPWRAAPSAA